MRAWVALALLTAAAGCECGSPEALPLAASGSPHRGAPQVWIVDDGERIGQGSGISPRMAGSEELWSPGGAIALFGLRDETLAIQVVVTAGDAPLAQVEVALRDVSAACLAPAERFVMHDLPLRQRSGGRDPRASLGWTAAATPPSPPAGAVPDALMPVSLAPSWLNYPMSVPRGSNRVVWMDLHVPADAPSGDCQATVHVSAGATTLADIPLRLRVAAASLPYRSLKTMVYFDPAEVASRMDEPQAIQRHHQLLHAHHLSVVMPLRSAAEVEQHGDALDGSLFDSAHGYVGPGQGVAADVAIVGAYGSLGPANAGSLGKAEEILQALAARGVAAPASDVFLYAVDEQCDSPLGGDWRKALDAAGGRLAALRVGHSCSTPPAGQPVDVVMMLASEYDTTQIAAARKLGKQVWIYNGVSPHTGSFLSDGWPVAMRANAWIQARYDIERWFYWESTFWDDNNRGGHGRYDPLATAETFHNADGDHCNGDGVLVYPGKQRHTGARSLGSTTLLPSMRLKQWRRGISDMGYLKLARQRDRAAADAVLKRIVPRALQDAGGDSKPPFSVDGAAYRAARRALFDIIVAR